MVKKDYTVWAFAGVIFILGLVATVFFFWQKSNQTEVEMAEMVEMMTYEKEQLEQDYTDLSVEMEGFSYKTNNDSILKLLDLNIDYLKIDKEMVSNATQRTITILKSLFDLTKELGIEIVSEGIEDEECLKRLQEVGCHLYQSEYFDKALSPRYFENRLKNPMY